MRPRCHEHGFRGVELQCLRLNQAPVLNAIGNQAGNELSNIGFTATASDPDAGQTLTYSLVGAPAGASIDPSTGVFTFTPTEAQGPGSYTFDVVVTDNGSPNLSDSETITVTVNEVNTPPTLVNPGNQVATEMVALNLQLSGSDVDLPANTLTYAKVSGPAGLTVSPSGAVAWTPGENDGGTNPTVEVSLNDGTATVTQTFSINVSEANQNPVLDNPGPQSASEGSAFSLQLTGHDDDLPAQTLTYAKVGGPTSLSVSASGLVTWTPGENDGGTTPSVTVSLTDGEATVQQTFTITVAEVNEAPTANVQSVSTNEDTAKLITMTASDPDLPAQTLTWSYTQPAHGTVTGTAPNVLYTPDANYNGPDSFTFKVNDSVADSNTATVSITVTPVNDPPTAVDDPYSTNMNTPLHVAAAGVLANDTDIDGGALSAVLVTDVAHGTLTLNSDGSFDYTPAPNFHGDDTFTYKANDGTADSNVATVTITVVQTNQPPVATNVNTSTPEDTAKLITLTATDPDNDPLTYSIVSGPSFGTLGTVSGNQVTYTPNLNYNGNDSFTFKANDGTADSNVATVTITVTPVNDLTVEVYGSPAPNAFGSSNWGPYRDNAMNSLENGLGDIGDRTVTPDAYQQVTNIPWRDVVVSGFVSWRGVAGTTVPFNAEYGNRLHFGLRVLGNGTRFSLSQLDFDVSSDDPTNSLGFTGSFDGTDNYSASRKGIDYGADRVKGGVDDTIITSGPATQEVDELIYVGVGNALDATFEPGLTDQDKLNSVRCFVEQLAPIHVTGAYKIRDGLGGYLGQGQTIVTIVPTNTLPVAQNQTVTVAEDGSTPITLVATDADNEPLTYTVTSTPTHGTLTGTAPNLTYTPDADYYGADSFTFKATDCVGDSNLATVTINVTPVNDAPILGAVGNKTVDELATLSFNLSSSDVDGGAPTYSYSGTAAGLTVNPSTGAVTWTPTEAQGPGDYSATFTVDDGAGGTDTETINIHVNEVNVAPTADAQSVSTDEDTNKAITLTGSDTDLPAQTLSYTVVDQPTHGTLTGTAPNLTYHPAADYHGPDSFTFKVNDEEVDSATATVSITVDPVNDAPVADSQSVSTAEDTAKAITMVANDVDGDSLTYTIVTAPQFGTLTGTGANRTYTPNLNFNGNDSFTFKANDGTADSNIATVSITVTPVQDVVMTVVGTPAPNSFGGASWDGYLTNAINSLRNGLGNVGDRNTDPTAYEEVTQIPWKDIAVTGFESWRGEAHPAAPFDQEFGVRLHFGVHVLGNGDRISLARLKVDMSSTDPINELGFSQDFGTLGTPYSTRRTGIDWGPDRKRGTGDDIVLNSGEPGTTLCDELVLVGLGNAFDTYSQSGFTDQEMLDELRCYIETRAPFDVTSVYTLRDGLGGTLSTSSATVNVMATNTLPTAQNQTVTTPANTPVDITLVATDPDNETLAYQVVTGPTHGTLTGTAPDLTYTPDTNFVGTDSFVFKASDCIGDSNLATVTIIVGSPLSVNFTVRQKGVDADVSRVIEFTVGGTGGANNRITLRKVVNFTTPTTVDGVPSREGTLTLAYADLDLADNNALDNSVPANAVFTKAYVKDPFFSLGKSVGVTGSAGTYSATADLVMGDLTNNNVVNVADLAVWAAYNGTGQSPNTGLTQPATPRQANLDGQGDVDLSDRQLVLAAYLTAGDGNDVGPFAAGNGSKRVMDIVLETGLNKALVRSMDLDGDGWVTREEVLTWSRGNR
ncbi:MAG: Ig-like domain-containing protein [Fimbriimonadales bacterium]